MLHIHNGDSTACTARKADIPGEHLAWREALVCGPTPGELTEQHFLDVRAQHLAAAYGVAIDKCAAELRSQHDALANFSEHEEVVLWFEHDLFCQVQLIYILNWFAGRPLRQTKLSLICVDNFPGVQAFHGLGQLNEDQLTSLWPQRQEVEAAQLDLGAKAWQAYSSVDARSLISLLRLDLSPLPFLKNALLRHLQRFPSTRNGLGRIENAVLELIVDGRHKFGALFPAFSRRESDYGYGDAQLYLAMRRLANASTPVLAQTSGDNSRMDPGRIFLSRFEITRHGEAALAGAEDFVVNNGIDRWLGGIHLEGRESAWRWDEDSQQLLVSL